MKSDSIAIVSHYAKAILNFRGPLIEDLILSGKSVVVMAPDWTPATRRDLRLLGAETVDMPLNRNGINPIHDLRTFIFLVVWFLRNRPMAVLCYAAKTNTWGILAATLSRVPRRIAMVEGLGYVFTDGVDGRRTYGQRIVAFMLQFLYRISFCCASKVIVLNPDDARDLSVLCGLSMEKTSILGGIGVDLQVWAESPPHIYPITFTLVSRMLREKGVIEFLQAAEYIKIKYPETHFLLLGGCDTNPGAIPQSYLESWASRGIVQWLGHVDVKKWLPQTSVFVLPSYREGVPRSTQEAMSMARPIITTDVPGCRETIVDGFNGYMIPPRNVGALVSAMESFILDNSQINRMGLASRQLAEERFNVHEVNARLISIIYDGVQ